MKMRMLKMERLNNCIAITIISKDEKSERIFILKEKINYVLIQNNIVMDKDSFSFVEMYSDSKNINFKFTCLEGTGGDTVSGQIHNVSIDLHKFKAWYNSEQTIGKFLEIKEKITIKTVITSTNFKNVLKTKLKRQLIKKIIFLSRDYYNDELIIGNDWEKNSFSFCKLKNGHLNYNGGIILHTNTVNGKQYYSIHT